MPRNWDCLRFIPDWKNVSGKNINRKRCDFMVLWENSEASLLLYLVYWYSRYVLLTERIWSISISFIFFGLYDVHGVWELKQVLPLPRKPLGRIVYGLCFLPGNVFSIRCIQTTQQSMTHETRDDISLTIWSFLVALRSRTLQVGKFTMLGLYYQNPKPWFVLF